MWFYEELCTLGGLLHHNQFLSLPAVDRWQVIRDHLILPIAHHSVSFRLLCQVILVFDIHSSIVLEVTHRKLVHFLSEKLLAVLCIQGLINAHVLLYLGLLAENKLLNTILSHFVIHRGRFDLKITSKWR